MTLDKAKIQQLRSQKKSRGEHPALVTGFVASGLPALLVNEHPNYSAYDTETLKTKVQGIKLAYTNFRAKQIEAGISPADVTSVEVIWDDDTGELYLFNTQVVDAMPDEDMDV
jgi:hypothetical protein